MPQLKETYNDTIKQKMMEKFDYENIMKVPKVEKIIVHMGVGEAKDNPKLLDSAMEDMKKITGQQPVIRRARKSVAGFQIKEGMPIGCKVTLRREKMYHFLDKLINVSLPRVRDFKGVSPKSFDGRGNYSLGVKEQLIFPEIEYDDVEKIQGMDIIINTSAETDEEAKELLSLLGMPFAS